MKDNVLTLTVVRILVVLACLILASAASAQSLPTWMGSFSYQGTTYNYTMVGTAPSNKPAQPFRRYLCFSGSSYYFVIDPRGLL
jgi:hypothetical protein